jgi:signal transduction histidine kinase
MLLQLQAFIRTWQPSVDKSTYGEYISIQAFHNMKRVRVFTFILLGIHIPLIVFDILALQSGDSSTARWRLSLLQTHIAIVVAMLCFVPLVLFQMPTGKNNVTPVHTRIGYMFGFVCIVWCASVSSVDQMLINSITVYIMGCLGVASFLLLGFRSSILVFASGCCVMIIGIVVIQPSAALQFSNTINAIAFTVIAWSFSRILSSARLRDVASALTIERQRNNLLEINEELLLANRQTNLQQEQLQQRNTELMRLNNEKNEVLGIVAHDLRNPLTVIQSGAEVLLHMIDDDQKMMNVAQRMLDTSVRMNKMVAYLLERDELEKRIEHIELSTIPIGQVIEATLIMFQDYASEKSIRLHYSNKFLSGDGLCVANEILLFQVIENLISNAIKYSPHYKNVWVEVQQQDYAMVSSLCCQVRVKDEGPGITIDDQKKLFGKFARLTARPTGGEHSTGLGLSIVKKMVEAMNGRVWCESEVGKGATFIVELPSAG